MGRIHLGTILGTRISLDFSFIILIVFFVLTYAQRAGMQYALLWAPVLLISILFHELAHAAMIGILGFGPSEIVLQGIGGATFNKRRARPWQDLLISLVGPLSSFALGYAVLMVPLPSDPFFRALIPLLSTANIWWAFFNLLPVGPIDGGNALRNFLRLFLRDRIAFVISVWTSIIVGSAVAILGVVSRQIFLALLMLWYIRDSYMQWQFFRQTNRPDD